MKKIIGIIGNKESGKTFGTNTIIEYLQKHDPTTSVAVIPLSRPIKATVETLFPENDADMDSHEWKEGKDNAIFRELGITPRRLMQEIGSKLRDINENIFVCSVIYRIRMEIRTKERIVCIIPDIRYRNEYTVMANMFGDDLYCYRAVNMNVQITDNHASEMIDWVDEFPQIETVIWKEPDEYRSRVHELVRKILTS